MDSWIFGIDSHFSIQMEGILGGESSVLSIEVRKAHEGARHPGHGGALWIELSCGKGVKDAKHERQRREESSQNQP